MLRSASAQMANKARCRKPRDRRHGLWGKCAVPVASFRTIRVYVRAGVATCGRRLGIFAPQGAENCANLGDLLKPWR